MAGSKFEYVRAFEADDKSLPNTWIVIRLDGRSFHKFSSVHKFAKPNDDRALNLMTCAAHYVMCDFRDIVLAYGQSDEYSFVFSRNTKQFNRRASKLVSNVVSLFTSAYVFYWSQYFGDEPLAYAPSFDGRVVLYPTDQNLKDYLSWRQADCHINNLYNTCFWSLVQSQGLTPNEAQQRLKDTVSSDKNELLFSQFGINYNSLPELYRKGTILLKQPVSRRSGAASGEEVAENKPTGDSVTVDTDNISTLHCDIIGNKFWTDFPHILNNGR